jgi:hypothetical protein
LAILAAQTTDTAEFISLLHGGCGDLLVIREIDTQSKARNVFKRLDSALTYIPPTNTNVYIGMFAHNDRDATAGTATSAGAVWADFDDTGDAAEVVGRIQRAGLPNPSIIVSSGHGIHAYWLLAKRARPGEMVPVLSALAVALGSDGSVCDAARIMRLPGSMNLKYSPAVPCSILSLSPLRYDLAHLQNILTTHRQPARIVQPVRDLHGVRELLESDMPCVRNMASGVKDGHRNDCLGRIVKDLQSRGYNNKAQAWDVVLRWNVLCSEPEDSRQLRSSFEYYWREPYRLLGCAQNNPVVQSIYSDYCVGVECERRAVIGSIKLDDAVDYNNRILNRIGTVSGYALICYAILQKHSEGLNTTQLRDKLRAADGTLCMGESMLRYSLKRLRSLGFILTIRGNTRAGQEDFHKVQRQGTYGTGFTLVSYGAVRGAVRGDVTADEFRLYCLLCRYARRKGRCYPSLQTLAKDLGVDASTVSRQLKNLERADYLKRYYGYKNNPWKLTYKLLL